MLRVELLRQGLHVGPAPIERSLHVGEAS
jgi:hypothetical protein